MKMMKMLSAERTAWYTRCLDFISCNHISEYSTMLHRNFMTLRQVLIQRLLISEVIENILENSIPYLSYIELGSSTKDKPRPIPRVEKEYLKPAYAASIGQEIEDGLFDDFLELVLQFGMIMMFACAFPLVFAFAAVNNIAEIRADALKLLVMMKRPIPRADATIRAWLNIFQIGDDHLVFQMVEKIIVDQICLLVKGWKGTSWSFPFSWFA
ncbi:anoctamin-like protein os01g0706700 [Phtheirospermum japonicum]|uniref:Anoctamin-like protein os01g0706700 n=1 Tax=Phtheirospermum japonicum TaxID=374723 RepID=A0A830CPP5_9LAMI|nr:anoctamin-like protein os01g0706700 [Phtheirospermum japonicum]